MDEFLSTLEISLIMGVTRQYIYDLCKKGDFIEHEKVTHNRFNKPIRLYDTNKFYAWLDKRNSARNPLSPEVAQAFIRKDYGLINKRIKCGLPLSEYYE